MELKQLKLKNWHRVDHHFIFVEFEDGVSGEFQASRYEGWEPEDDVRFMEGGILLSALHDYLTDDRNYGYGFYICGYNGRCQSELQEVIKNRYNLFIF